MNDEYDVSKGVRGKHYKAYREGPSLRIRHEDGTVEEHHFTLEDGAVMLDPDIRAHFPTSESVNEALRKYLRERR